MIIKFENDYLENLFTGEPIKGKPKYNDSVIKKFKKVILILKNVESSIELSKFRGLNFEALKGNKKGLHSISVDYGYRLEFKLENDVIQLTEIVIIEELSNHYK
ncbi:MAG: type II toxin-antitoxin system RelE/ParE family toxin [Bacteroidota bacterium]